MTGKREQSGKRMARQTGGARSFRALVILLMALLTGCRAGEAGRRAPADSLPRVVWADSDRDGIPDAAELTSYNDRLSFRRWMAGIAEMQFYRMSDAWNPDQRDCAGLVRFAWREALRRHNRQWYQAMGEGYEQFAPDLRAYTLDRSPLGERLFRTDFGSFVAGDPEAGRFSDFADARTLKNHNALLVGREAERALPGDLLFFHQPWVQKFPYHVMIFIGEARHQSEGASDWVVYHTGNGGGAGAGQDGEVRKVRVATLRRHPDPRWRPVEPNRHFLGIYRLKILSEDAR